ncbi:MAG: hypothetical protein OEZ43_06145 [Gammaproteobacteria bacterium]|nr:hypothetical protein [Gammaproteobacteria bacterium]
MYITKGLVFAIALGIVASMNVNAETLGDDALIKFEANTPAKADDVNQNFEKLREASNSNEEKATQLETRANAVDIKIDAIELVTSDGGKANNNARNHDRYTDDEARAAVSMGTIPGDINMGGNNIQNVGNLPDGKTYASLVRIRTRGWVSTLGGSPEKDFAQDAMNGVVTIDGETVMELKRSYNLIVMERATGNIVFTQEYDVFDNAANAQAMADKLATLSIDHIVIVATFDEPKSRRLLNGLDGQMLRCGASQVFTGGQFRYRSAYALVGICDMGPGSGLEYYSGEVDNDTTAFVDASVVITDGSFNAPAKPVNGKWIDLPLAAGFSAYGNEHQTPQYRIQGDVVCLRGLATATIAAGNPNVAIANLPIGYRPPAIEIFSASGYNGGIGDRVDVRANGQVALVSQDTNTWVSLANMCFSISP